MRAAAYQKREELEALLREMEELFDGLELPFEPQAPEFPPVFILGSARSGTTLLHQYLAQSGVFAYPTNTLSRFYYAPYVGARIQQLLFEKDFKEEILPGGSLDREPFGSDLGKTQGPLAPHEFWYFWRRFFRFGALHRVDRERLEESDLEGVVKGLGSLEMAFQRPLLLKAMILQWDLDILERLFPNAIFVQVKRDLKANARSLLHARERFFGDRGTWYSFKPPDEYPELKDKGPVEQVLGQVLANERTVDRFFDQLAASRFIRISYEDLCRAPYPFLQSVAERIGNEDPGKSCPEELRTMSFKVSDGGLLDEENERELELLVEEYSRG